MTKQRQYASPGWFHPLLDKGLGTGVSMEGGGLVEIRTGGSATAARAMARSCRWPWDRLAPSESHHGLIALGQSADEGSHALAMRATLDLLLMASSLPKRMLSAIIARKQVGILKGVPKAAGASFDVPHVCTVVGDAAPCTRESG